MRRITQLFVNRPPLVFVLITLIALAGSYALATLVQQQFPNVDFPTINTSVSYPGASPSELRDSVVRPIEDAIAGAPDLDHITTSIQQNQASISATFTLDSNQTTDLTEVQDRLQSVKAALPQDLPAPATRSFDPAQATIVTLSVTSRSLSAAALSAIITNNVIPDIEQVDGVSSVGANGTVTPALEVSLDPAKLASRGFVPTDVVSAIQANNSRTPGGIAYSDNRETTLDVRGDVQTPESIADTLLTGNTSVLQGATSPSGALTVKYGNTSGSTNQALALGSSFAGAAAAATAVSGAASGSTSSGVSASTGSSSAASSGTSSTSGTATTSLSAAGSSSAASPAPSAAATLAAGTSSVTSTVALAGSAFGTPVPQITPVAVPTAVSALTSTSTSQFAAPTLAPVALATAAPATVTGTTTTVATSNFGSSAVVSASAAGSGAASSGAASSATEPFSTSAFLPRIGDVANVTDWYEPKRVYSYVNGQPAISLNVQKATGASEVQSSENVIAALPAIEAKYPDIAFKVLNVQADDTKAQLYGSWRGSRSRASRCSSSCGRGATRSS